MTDKLVTIVVVQRERFSFTRQALESLYEFTTPPFQLVYVDGGSPPDIKQYLERESQKRNFHLIRKEQYLAPNVARNLGLEHVQTPYVVFIDNDVVVTKGWLDRLIQCAEEEQAWIVGPVYCIGKPEDQIIHMAGGDARIHVRNNKRVFSEKHRFANKPLASVRPNLSREPVELVEFHCLFARTEIFNTLGPLDEQLKGTREHIDLCLQVQEAGGSIFFEPQSLITYVPPPPFKWADIKFYLVRWSSEWTLPTLHHFYKKWDLAETQDMDRLVEKWLTPHRRLALRPLRKIVRVLFGKRLGDWSVDSLENMIIKRSLTRA